MAYETEALFREDSYLSTAEGTVLAITETGGIILDQTNFYATSGGQPGISAFSSARMVLVSRFQQPLRAKTRTKSFMFRQKDRLRPLSVKSWSCMLTGRVATS